MEELEFKIKSGIKTGDPKVDEYIEQLHQYLTSFETSNIRKLIVSLDKLSGVLAEDIEMLIAGEDWVEDPTNLGEAEDGDDVVLNTGFSRLKILSDAKDSKVFERLMTLFSKIKDIDAVSKTAKSLIPDIEEWKDVKEDVKEVVKISSGSNSFEQAQEQQFKRRQGKVIV